MNLNLIHVLPSASHKESETISEQYKYAICTYVVLRSGLGEGYPLLNSVDYHPSPHIDLFFFAKKTQHNSLSLVLFFLFLLPIFLKTVTRSFHFWGDVCYKWLFVIRLLLSHIFKIILNRIGSITIKYICVFHQKTAQNISNPQSACAIPVIC